MSTTTVSRKSQIYSVAQMLFREKGFAGTSMRDLAKEVGIEPASLYSHISSKEEILKEICFRIAEEFFEAINAVITTDLPAAEKLRKAIIAHIQVIKNNLDASTVFFNEWKYLNEPSLSEFKLLRKRYEQLFRHLIEAGITENQFRNLNLRIIIPVLFSAMNWTYDWHKPAEDLQPDLVGDQIFNMLFNGIKY